MNKTIIVSTSLKVFVNHRIRQGVCGTSDDDEAIRLIFKQQE